MLTISFRCTALLPVCGFYSFWPNNRVFAAGKPGDVPLKTTFSELQHQQPESQHLPQTDHEIIGLYQKY